MKASELIEQMKKKRRKTIFGKQIPVIKDGDTFIGFNSDIEYSYTHFTGSIRYKIKDIEERTVNFFPKNS